MVTLPTITNLSLVGVADPGVPNKERIVLRPLDTVNLGEYVLLLGARSTDGGVVPLADHVYWFGENVVFAPSWVFVYTGPGSYEQSTVPDGTVAHSYHWGKETTMFGTRPITPVLVRLGGVDIGISGPTHAPEPLDVFADFLRRFPANPPVPDVDALMKLLESGDPRPPGAPPSLSDLLKARPSNPSPKKRKL